MASQSAATRVGRVETPFRTSVDELFKQHRDSTITN